MLVPQAFLAALCVGLGPVPGPGAARPRKRDRVAPRARSRPDMARGPAEHGVRDSSRSTHVVPVVLGRRCWLDWPSRRCSSTRRAEPRRGACRRGDAAVYSAARTEYTATAFSKPLMMIFRAVYRPTREVEALAEGLPVLPAGSALSRLEIEPTFERYVYRSAAPRVLRVADGNESAAGREPPCLPRLRDRPRREPGALGLVEKLSVMDWSPSECRRRSFIRAVTVAATLALLRRAGRLPPWRRWVGSILASRCRRRPSPCR